MSRIDHINNPEAPEPNSVVPSTVAFVTDDEGRVLLIQRSDNGDWALPGGGHDLRLLTLEFVGQLINQMRCPELFGRLLAALISPTLASPLRALDRAD